MVDPDRSEFFVRWASWVSSVNDLLLQANFFQKKDGFFYSSFFDLTIGLERLMKLAVFSDFMLNNSYAKARRLVPVDRVDSTMRPFFAIFWPSPKVLLDEIGYPFITIVSSAVSCPSALVGVHHRHVAASEVKRVWISHRNFSETYHFERGAELPAGNACPRRATPPASRAGNRPIRRAVCEVCAWLRSRWAARDGGFGIDTPRNAA
jgi:hypothetical protein